MKTESLFSSFLPNALPQPAGSWATTLQLPLAVIAAVFLVGAMIPASAGAQQCSELFVLRTTFPPIDSEVLRQLVRLRIFLDQDTRKDTPSLNSAFEQKYRDLRRLHGEKFVQIFKEKYLEEIEKQKQSTAEKNLQEEKERIAREKMQRTLGRWARLDLLATDFMRYGFLDNDHLYIIKANQVLSFQKDQKTPTQALNFTGTSWHHQAFRLNNESLMVAKASQATILKLGSGQPEKHLTLPIPPEKWNKRYLSQDGHLLFSASPEFGLRVISVDGPEPSLLLSIPRVSDGPRWIRESPNGRYFLVGMNNNHQILYDRTKNQEIETLEMASPPAHHVYESQFSPDSQKIYYLNHRGFLFEYDILSGQRREITPHPEASFDRDQPFFLSNDGRLAYFIMQQTPHTEGQLIEVELQTGKARDLSSPNFSKLITSKSNSIETVHLKDEDACLIFAIGDHGEVKVIWTSLLTGESYQIFAPAVRANRPPDVTASPDGKTLLLNFGGENLYLYQ